MAKQRLLRSCCFFFFFNDTATTEIYTLSLHDALPISDHRYIRRGDRIARRHPPLLRDRKSTRLNSSHLVISYAVFCLKKKKNHTDRLRGRGGDRDRGWQHIPRGAR